MKQNIAAQAGVEPANVWALKIVKNTPKPILFTSYQRKPALKNQIMSTNRMKLLTLVSVAGFEPAKPKSWTSFRWVSFLFAYPVLEDILPSCLVVLPLKLHRWPLYICRYRCRILMLFFLLALQPCCLQTREVSSSPRSIVRRDAQGIFCSASFPYASIG